ncbi:30S ribosomal protein S16 [Rhodothermus marinus]|uniref:30S ribosomal protein S16 n=1 Tax=Rhodothermus marinus TaxID=29549 RepID=UPI001DBF4059|nr:30S ribosomal protein S16 [Rhodothermus marinus]MBO2491551.1 30S ribosomal protein S16 [Rhodothermus marinus]
MAVRLRLRRLGRRNLPIFAIVAADARSPRDGRFIEDLGRYYPLHEPATVELKADRVIYWLERGAQPTETVRSILRREGLLLAMHLRRKGKSEEEIQQAVAEHRARQYEKLMKKAKPTVAQLKQAALEEERRRAAELEAELARQQAEAEAKARAEAEQQAAAEAEAEAAEAEAEAAESEAVAEAETPAEPEAAAEESASDEEEKAS